MHLIRIAAFALACSSVCLGCLSQSYKISTDELRRATQIPVEDRGAGLNVVQQSIWNRDIERSEPEAYRGRYSEFGIWVPWHGHHSHHRGRSSRRSTVLSRSSSSSSSSGGDSSAVKAAAAVAIAAALAATAIVTISATEGARFDGVLTMPKDQPILLFKSGGGRQWVPLEDLTLEKLDGVSSAAVAGFDAGVRRLRRNPLNRQGWTYQTEFGASSMTGATGQQWNGFSGRAALGFMPDRRYGLLLGAAFVSGQQNAREVMRGDAEQVVEMQTFLQAEWWPLSAARLHAGPYVTGGYAWGVSDLGASNRKVKGLFAGAGVAVQLDWTTRLAVSLRVGTSMLPSLTLPGLPSGTSSWGGEGYHLATAATLGLSVY